MSAPRFLPYMIVAYSGAAMLTTDLYLPGMPALTRVFDTSIESVQLTFTLFLGAFALAQIFYGPLSDRFGRRPVMLWGGVGFIAATALCALAATIEMLLVARILQATAVASLTVTSRALVRELYDDVRLVRISGVIAMIEALAPAVGPVIGAEIIRLAGWRWTFGAVAIWTVLVLIVLLRWLPESLPQRNPDALRLRPMMAGFAAVLRNPAFLGAALPVGLIFAGLMAYLTAAPFLLIDRLGLSPRGFALSQMACVLAYIAGVVITNAAVARIGTHRLIASGTAVVLGGGALMAALALAGVGGWAAVVAPFAVYALGIGLLGAPLIARAMSADARHVGAIASLLGTVTMGCAFAGSLLATLIYDGTALSVAVPVAILGVAALGVYAAFTRPAAPVAG